MYVRRKYKKKVIDIEFNKTQIDFMKKIGISFNFSNISDEDYILIEEKVSAYLQKKASMKIIHLTEMVKCVNQY